jgi:hypothetical protein
MKKIFSFLIVMFLSYSLIAQEDEGFHFDDDASSEMAELLEATDSVVDAATQTCRSLVESLDAKDDEKVSFLLNCVNEELHYEGYLPIFSLDK